MIYTNEDKKIFESIDNNTKIYKDNLYNFVRKSNKYVKYQITNEIISEKQYKLDCEFLDQEFRND